MGDCMGVFIWSYQCIGGYIFIIHLFLYIFNFWNAKRDERKNQRVGSLTRRKAGSGDVNAGVCLSRDRTLPHGKQQRVSDISRPNQK